ncbi:MAG: hypothetical protein KBT70_01090 [Roseovarius sp.]|uniref:hypothetical protein n=1 Tax=Roseovarius sp. TaxID=1486281 RepID=UPI001B596B49|nr:hypothetical protein [Roseovarius sp.]MBQ0748768.1 hypothetical protein [Roseovarius sp.]MBQ0809666.1 hypothetical protein [Roseovarius sp.]
MGRSHWHVIEDEEGGALTVARRVPVRFDLAVETVLAGTTGRRRLAHLVRQDLWRALQSLRGYAPAVRVRRDAQAMHVQAGGAVMGRFDRAGCEALIAQVLEDEANRVRWMGGAR